MTQQYLIRELSEEEFKTLFDKHKDSVFDNTHSYDYKNLFSDSEKLQIQSLKQNAHSPYKLYLGIYNSEDHLVGWSWGLQENALTFYMVNSAILKEHRRNGCYSALIDRMIKTLSEKGFQLIYSRHCATNNAVIIPKLKAGFVISKMEIDDRFGVLIHLHYYTNKNRLKIMDYRTGQTKPDKQIKDLFNI